MVYHGRATERVGFEPTEPQAAQRFSRPPDSTALASLQAPLPRFSTDCPAAVLHTRPAGRPGFRGHVWRRRVLPAAPFPSGTLLTSDPRDIESSPRGFEPPTFGSAIQCSIQLSYGLMVAALSCTRAHAAAERFHCAFLPPCARHGWSYGSTRSTLRRGGDSNPRYPLEVQRLSRAPDSATLAPLQILSHSRAAVRPIVSRPRTRGSAAAVRRGLPLQPCSHECDQGAGEK